MAVDAVIQRVQSRAEFGSFFIANFTAVKKKERIAESAVTHVVTDR